MLRQGRLRQADIGGKIADGPLAMLDKFAQHHQAATIADRFQRLRQRAGLPFEGREVYRGLEHHNAFIIRYC